MKQNKNFEDEIENLNSIKKIEDFNSLIDLIYNNLYEIIENNDVLKKQNEKELKQKFSNYLQLNKKEILKKYYSQESATHIKLGGFKKYKIKFLV